MKNNKLFKWLYGIFMFLPMLAIGVCCAYVTFNKNAKDSYYGENINEKEITTLTTMSQLSENEWYHFDSRNFTNPYQSATGSYSQRIYFTQFKNVESYGVTIDDTKTFNFINPYISNEGKLSIYIQYFNGLVDFSTGNKYIAFDFIYEYDTVEYNVASTGILQSITYNSSSYLDNAFYYAIDKFNECGFNKVDFVSFFDFFNTQNNIYITFVNTYINYMLFVSLAFFIPRVLMWFIGFAYGLTDSYSGRSLW